MGVLTTVIANNTLFTNIIGKYIRFCLIIHTIIDQIKTKINITNSNTKTKTN